MRVNDFVHVAVAVIVVDGQVLIAKRPEHLHQGGLWEFPGGKLEPGESVTQALERELKEELDITIKPERPLISVSHDYGDKKVLLDVWLVHHFEGRPCGYEGQTIAWVPLGELNKRKFPVANQPIITALNLPEFYLISPEPDLEYWHAYSVKLESALKRGVRLVQFRAKNLTAEQYFACAQQLEKLTAAYKARLVLNTSPDVFQAYADRIKTAALHLGTEHLLSCQHRPVDKNILLSASCHNLAEIRHAQLIDADFITLSPVKTTTTHPGMKPMGLDTFKALVADCKKPVYALGGLVSDDLAEVFDAGGQGVAAIRGLWY